MKLAHWPSGPSRGGGVAGASAPGPEVLRGPRGPLKKNLSWCEKSWKRAGRNGEVKNCKKPLLIWIVWAGRALSLFNAAKGLIISQMHIVPLPSEVLVASGLYCKILTLYKIIKLIQCTTDAWLLLRFLSFLRLFLFVYKITNSSDVWSHRRRECLLLGVIPPRTSLRQRPKWDGGHNVLLFLVSLKSSPWQWQGFQQNDRHNDSISVPKMALL